LGSLDDQLPSNPAAGSRRLCSYNNEIAEAPTFGNGGSGLPVAVASAVELGEAKESKLGRSFSIPFKPMRVL
jgi:hypothetical protein